MGRRRFRLGPPPRIAPAGLTAAVLALGLGHALPAHAGAATVNPVQTTTYQLTPSKNPITFGPQTNIDATSGNGDGVFDNSNTKWKITNYGLISTSGLFGIATAKATTVTNFGTISGPALGVALQTGSKITNAQGASILGGAEIQGSGTITNSGTITGEVYLSKGTFTNTATGVLSNNSITPFVALGSNLTNSGMISNTGGDAIDIGDSGWGAGSLNNTKTGQITAAGIAVESYVGSKSLTNAGEIQGSQGVDLLEGGKLVNASGGSISGTDFGVGDYGSQPGHASTIVNQAGGTIQGANEGIYFHSNAGATTITNGGSITSPQIAVRIAGGSISNLAGGLISSGEAAGDEAILVMVNSATVTNAGQISGSIILGGGGKIANAKSGLIYGSILADTPVVLNNAGIWQLNAIYDTFTSHGGSITNTGLIQGDPLATTPQVFEVFGPTSFKNGSSGATGTINLSNGIVGDTLQINAPFAAATGHSVLTLDAFLGGPGSLADELQLTAGSSGQTLIRIHDTNTGLGAVNSNGIVLVTGATAASNFALDPKGPGYDKANKGIDHGLFLYSLQFNSGEEMLVGTVAPTGHQLATFLTVGQSIPSDTDFSSSGGSSGGAGFAGFANEGSINLDRPMFWTAAVNTLSPDPMAQGRYVGRPGGGLIAAPPSLRLSAMQSSGGMDTGYDQGLAMLKGGMDLIRHRDGDASFSLGIGTAYVQSDQRFTEGGTAMFYSGVVYGGYAAWRSGPLYLNASFKSAMLKAQYQAPWLANSNPSSGLTSTGVEIDGGSSYALAGGWSLQPIASMAANRTSMADLQIGTELAQFKSGYTGWVNAGAQLQGGVRIGGYQLQSLFTARVWDRFGDNTAYLASLGSGSPLIDQFSGVSGELAAELRLSAGPNLYGFVQTSARAGMAETSASALAGFALRW